MRTLALLLLAMLPVHALTTQTTKQSTPLPTVGTEHQGDLVVRGKLTVQGDDPNFRTEISGDTITVYNGGKATLTIAQHPRTKQTVLDIGDSSRMLLRLADAGAFMINMNQLRGYWATEIRTAPDGSEEPGIMEFVGQQAMRDESGNVQREADGRVVMKRSFAIEDHEGHSPGNKGGAETWTTFRIMNGAAVPGPANSPVFELFAIAPWSPVPGNQPYLKPGTAGIYMWGKDLPTYFSYMDAMHNGDRTALRIGTTANGSFLTVGEGGDPQPLLKDGK